MEIKIGSVVLAPGGRSGPSGMTLRFHRSEQIRRAIRAPGVTVFDRKNLIMTCSFKVYRVHDSAAAALVFIFDHSIAANTVGQIEFIKGATSRKTNGSCIVEEAVQIGRSTVHTYTLTGGALV